MFPLDKKKKSFFVFNSLLSPLKISPPYSHRLHKHITQNKKMYPRKIREV